MSNELTPITNTALTIVQDDELTKDYAFAKANMQNIIMKGNEVLDELMNVAISSQQARAFEVLTNLLKTMADANKQMMETSLLNQQVIEKKRHNNEPDSQKTTVNNNLFMSTADLAELINKKKE